MPQPAVSRLNLWYDGFLSLFFPRLCLGCTKNLNEKEEMLCQKCLSGLPRTNFENLTDNIAFRTFWGRVDLEFASAIFYYRKGELLQQLIHYLKYKKSAQAGYLLGKLTGRAIHKSPFYKDIDLIVPVPLHSYKIRIRGYNQCSLIVKGLSEVINIPHSDDKVLRMVHRESQTQKGHYARWENVDGVFFVPDESCFSGKHILLVDDVVTTGATIEACCHALRGVPGIRISVVTVGYAI